MRPDPIPPVLGGATGACVGAACLGGEVLVDLLDDLELPPDLKPPPDLPPLGIFNDYNSDDLSLK